MMTDHYDPMPFFRQFSQNIEKSLLYCHIHICCRFVQQYHRCILRYNHCQVCSLAFSAGQFAQIFIPILRHPGYGKCLIQFFKILSRHSPHARLPGISPMGYERSHINIYTFQILRKIGNLSGSFFTGQKTALLTIDQNSPFIRL